jgi:hypothetical protein
MLMGEDAIASAKLEFGTQLIILGMNVVPCHLGVRFQLCEKKARKWAHVIARALNDGHLDAGTAQKLAGRLSWATQMLFHRVGRAMIKPIFAQKASATGIIGDKLREALQWWLDVLRRKVSETRSWNEPLLTVCRLFVDAASTPPRCAAVLFVDGRKLYTDAAPSLAFMQRLNKRNDKQIMSLEIAAILLALTTFTNELRGRTVVLYSDNVGAEKTSTKGSAKAFDHNKLQHEIWSLVLEHAIHLWVERVPSRENISDLPSRFEYQLMKDMGAAWCEPAIFDSVLDTPPS